jgi:tight adherence protein B
LDILTSVGFGSALGGAVALAAAAVAARRREHLLAGLGDPGIRSGFRVRPRMGRMEARAREDGWSQGALSYGAVLLATGLLCALGGLRLFGFVGGAAGAIAGPLTVRAVLRRGAARTADLLDQQFLDAVQGLAAAVRAGLSVRRALDEVTMEAEEPLRGFLERAQGRLRVGEPLEAALASLANEVDVADASLVVSLLAIHRRSGGDLSAMLDEVVVLVGDRRRGRRDLRALTAQGRASGAVLAVLPIAFVTLLSGTGGDGLGDFYRTPTGSVLLLVGLTCEVLGFLWIRRIVRPRMER